MNNMPRIDITKNFCRKRIRSPKQFDRRSFRVVKPNKNTFITTACPKGKYNPKTKRCKVGLKTQSIAKRKIGKKCPIF